MRQDLRSNSSVVALCLMPWQLWVSPGTRRNAVGDLSLRVDTWGVSFNGCKTGPCTYWLRFNSGSNCKCRHFGASNSGPLPHVSRMEIPRGSAATELNFGYHHRYTVCLNYGNLAEVPLSHFKNSSSVSATKQEVPNVPDIFGASLLNGGARIDRMSISILALNS